MLKIDQLDLFFGDAQTLDQVQLHIPDKQIIAIVGSNGAGKTSLIRTICGIHKPSRGTIKYNDQEIIGKYSHEIVELGIGQVAEGRQIFPMMSVEENLEVGGSLRRVRPRLKQNLDRMYDMFPRLKERRLQLAGTLSGGEQQMLAIGRCLMSEPQLILFDEPSLGLSPLMVMEMFKIIQRLHESGLTIMLVEQNVQVSLELAQYAYVLENGRIALSGPAEELLTNKAVKEAYLGI